MKLRRNKKGFTIIELVIVIAVIGILAAVLIPTFVNLTNKANEANDNALVNTLNKALRMEEQKAGHQKSKTLEGAVLDLEEQGYYLEDLSFKSGKELVWSQTDNQFLLNTQGKSGKDYWKIIDAVPAQADQKYSYYASKNFNQTDVTVVYGFDAGRNTKINKVTYVGKGTEQSVAIRTNSDACALAVDSATDDVTHIGLSKEVNVIRVKMGTFNEEGKVLGNINLAQGKVELGNKGTCANVVIKDLPSAKESGTVTPTASTVSIVVDSGASVNTVISKSEAVPVADITSGEGASKVAKVEADDNNVAYIGTTGYETFAQALSHAKDATISLVKDASFASGPFTSSAFTASGKYVIDLNGYTLTQTDSYGFYVRNGADVTIKNGSYVANALSNGVSSLFEPQNNSKFTLNNVQLRTNGTAVYPRGDAAEANILNSTIVAGTYALGTNANAVENYNIKATVKNSTLSVTGCNPNDGDDCAILMNIPGSIVIEDSILNGHRQGLICRAGNVTVKNTIINQSYNGYSFDDRISPWGSGNEVPHYAVVVGSHETGSTASYKANAVLVFNGVTVNSDSNTFVYADANSLYTTSFNYDSASSVGQIVKCEGHASRIVING